MLVFLFVLSLIHNSKQWDNTLQSVYDKIFLDKLQNVPDTIPLCLPDNTTVRTFENHTTHMFVEVFVELYQLISVVSLVNFASQTEKLQNFLVFRFCRTNVSRLLT